MADTILNTAFVKYAPLLNDPAKAVTALGQRAIIHNEINSQIGHIVVQILQAHYEINSSRNIEAEIETYQEEQNQYYLQMTPGRGCISSGQWNHTLEKIVAFTKDIGSFLDDESDKKIGLNFDNDKIVRYSYEGQAMTSVLKNLFLEKFSEHAVLKTRFNTIDLLLSRLGEDETRFFKMARDLH